MIIAQFILVTLVGYLLGSIPFGLMIARRRAVADIRQHGSGRTGATNVLRTLGRKMALVVLGLDVIKGVAAVFFAGVIVGDNHILIGNFALGLFLAQVLAATGAIVGHIWPVFAHFKGGRGVATFCGGVIALYPAAAIFGGEVFVIAAGLTGFASLGSITGMVGAYAILVPLAIKHGFPVEYLAFVLFGTILITFMHRDNIKRLLSGKERRFSDKL